MAAGIEAPDYEKKYRSLKRKYKTLSEETLNLSKELSQAKKRIIRLHKERRFLLDKLLTYEQLSSDSDSLSSSSSEDERPRKREKKEIQEEERPAKREKRDDTPSARSNGHSKRSAAKDKDKDDGIQMCIARGKDDRPCKSKALQGFKYCWHHAPLDPTSPFIFCQYMDPNKRNAKKCNIPVAKDKPDPFCNYHIKLVAPKVDVELEGNGANTDNMDNTENTDNPELNDVDVEEGNFGTDGADDFSVSFSGEERSPEDTLAV